MSLKSAKIVCFQSVGTLRTVEPAYSEKKYSHNGQNPGEILEIVRKASNLWQTFCGFYYNLNGFLMIPSTINNTLIKCSTKMQEELEKINQDYEKRLKHMAQGGCFSHTFSHFFFNYFLNFYLFVNFFVVYCMS